MNITVYLGANEGREPALKTAVCELGTWIGEHGHTLVYGLRLGLMPARLRRMDAQTASTASS